MVSGLLSSSLEAKIETESFIAVVSFLENGIVTISKIAKFLTRGSKIPATGLKKNVTVKFKNSCFPRKSGNMCKCLPAVSTCEIIVNIPLHITSEEDMVKAFKDALLCETGYLFLFKRLTSTGRTSEELVLFFSTLSIQYMFKTLFN